MRLFGCNKPLYFMFMKVNNSHQNITTMNISDKVTTAN